MAVVGTGTADAAEAATAEQVGRILAERGCVVVCGGLGGVMEAVARGARGEGGTVVGLLPGTDRGDGNEHLSVAVATGLGEMRNALVVRSADAVIAVGGAYGTLSEIALALRAGTPVVGLDTWELVRRGRPDQSVIRAGDPHAAVELALAAAGGG